MVFLFYLRLIALTAGTLVYLFLIALILGHRRPRLFERLLFFLALALLAIYGGALLQINAEIQYSTPPEAVHLLSQALSAFGLLLLLPLVWHIHYAYRRQIRGSPPTVLAKPLLIVLYLAALIELAAGISMWWSSGLQSEARLSIALADILVWGTAGLCSVAFLDAVFEFQDWRAAKGENERSLFLALFCVSIILAVLLGFDQGGGLVSAYRAEALTTAIVCAGVLPGALLIYFALKRNFLEYGAQRNLVYALSATALALLYLALVHRISGWLAPMFPPEATASVLLFVLVFLFEPLERVLGPVIHRTFRERVDRWQRLAVDLQDEARHGDVSQLLAGAERRIRDEFGLARMRISVPRGPALAPLESPGGLGHVARIPLKKGTDEIGLLEAATTGSYLTGETSAALEFLAEQLPAMIDLCRLIEDKVRLERELAERERLALVGQMAASLSHNLRNPLGAMKTVLQVQLENPGLPGDLRRDSELVLGEINRMSAKLTQLLHFARPSTNQRRASAEDIATRVVALFRPDAERRGIRIELEPAAAAAAQLPEEAVNEILSNLVVNATEAQPDGGRVRVKLARLANDLEIFVEDDGPGISPEAREKIFQPFYTTKATGTGLGLAIVARRVAEMGGTATCESPAASGCGTRIRVTLPLAEKKEAPNSASIRVPERDPSLRSR